ncbi:MAG: AAA family ATPase, partial [Deltaproteobacteria bacterium]|nr:AAA family ATPase [Deltaproteobacteria bacterium]
LRQLVTPERTRAIAELSDLQQSGDPAETARVVNQLVEARLLVVQTREGGSSVELVHESLITSWPTLRRWLDDDAEDAQFRAQLAVAAKQWDAKARPAGLLWRGEAVDEARRWFDAQPRELAPRDRAFLDAAFTLARRGKRLRVIALAVTFSLLAAIAVILSVSYMRLSAEQAKTEEARVTAEFQRDRAVAAEHQRTAAQSETSAAVRGMTQAENDRRAAEAARRRAQGLADEKDLTIQEKNDLLEKEKAEALRNATEARAAQKEAERATQDAKRIAEKLELNRKELEVKLAAEKKLREEAEKRGKGLSKELK